MERFSDLGNYLSETGKYANDNGCYNEVNLPIHYHKYGTNNHVYFFSQDQMGREAQSKKKETIAIYEVDKPMTRIAAAVAVGFFGHN